MAPKFLYRDKTLTQRIVDIFHPLEIKVLDHIVVAGTSYTSMAEKGYLPYQCKDTANYDAIILDGTSVKKSRIGFSIYVRFIYANQADIIIEIEQILLSKLIVIWL